jgi:hypothetical protein
MNVFVIMLAVLMNGEISVLEYSNGTGKAVEFPTKAACEKKNAELRKGMDAMLPADVTFVDQMCVPRVAKGGA